MMNYIKKVGLTFFLILFFISCTTIKQRENKQETSIKRETTGKKIEKRERSERNVIGTKSNTRVDLYGKYKKDSYPTSRKIPYLAMVNDLDYRDRRPFKRYNEKEFLEFYRDLDVKGYGDGSIYWRWKVEYSDIKLKYLINEHLYSISQRRKREVLTYKNGKWINQSLSKNPVGDIIDLKILQRGESGIAIKLLVKGSKGEFLVIKEANIRYLLGASRNIGSDVKLYGASGGSKRYSKSPIMTNPRLLPSAFIAIKRDRGSYIIYGGGFGHGVGVPQWAVNDLTKHRGYSYNRVIKRYYKDTRLKNIRNIKEIDGKVRVGIMTNNFSAIEHKNIKMYSTAKMKLKTGAGDIELPADSKVEFKVNDKHIEIICNGKSRVKTKRPVKIESKGMIGLMNIKRNIKKYKYPMYRGGFEVKLTKNARELVLINEINIEDYLLQVVPSEMPASFGLEALKVQAITARTYVVKDILRNRYKNLGFNILDSAQSQVYNNLDENSIATNAVKATRGLVIVYNDEPIDAKYYSTSSGINSHAHNAW